ncbi:MAG: O-antigen ligase family protein [Deltaproteobacteria bacterium]|nr:O-antigen ligase family protein [Deltaproteobacteria bacterium]
MQTFKVTKKTDGIEFNLIILFVISVFLVSYIRINMITTASLVAILMCVVFVMNSLLKGRFSIVSHPVQKGMLALFFWVMISLLISKLDPSKAFPADAYAYVWAKGLSSPDIRGISFLIRLLLSLFAMNFIICTVNSKERFFKTINYYLLFYFIVCLYVLLQFMLHSLLGIEIGELRPSNIETLSRTGGYLGESSILAGVIVSGYFLTIAFANKGHQRLWFPRWLFVAASVVATLDLISTFSSAWILSALLAFSILSLKHLGKRGLLLIFVGIAVFGLIFQAEIYEAIFRKTVGQLSHINVRTSSWVAGISIFFDHMLTGVGIGQSVFFVPSYLKDIAVNYFLVPDVFLSLFLASRFPPMNTYIQWMAETGIIGIILLFYICYQVLRSGRGITDPENSRIVKFGLGGALITTMVAINASPDYLYVGFLNFLASMYVAGGRVFGTGTT